MQVEGGVQRLGNLETSGGSAGVVTRLVGLGGAVARGRGSGVVLLMLKA